MLSITAGSSIHATLVVSVSAGNKRLHLAEFGRSESGWLGPFLLRTCRLPNAARAGGSGYPVYCTAQCDRPLFWRTHAVAE